MISAAWIGNRMVLLKNVVQVSQWICRYGKVSCVELISCQFIIQAALPRLHSILLGRLLLGLSVDDVSFPGSADYGMSLGLVDGKCRKGRSGKGRVGRSGDAALVVMIAQEVSLWYLGWA